VMTYCVPVGVNVCCNVRGMDSVKCVYVVTLSQWYSTWGARTLGGTPRHLRGYVK
jgi:hypothetical protein